MKEFYHLTDKYGFKAPLVCLDENFDFNAFTRLSNALNVSPTSTAFASDIFISLQRIEEQIASLDYVSAQIGKKTTAIRHHLVLLEKSGLVESEFITTDKIRKRRGKLFKLIIPTGKKIASTTLSKQEEVDQFELIPSDNVQTIDIHRYDESARFLELNVIRYLVKAMRTNRKDSSNKISVEIRNDINKKPIKITARAEEGRLVYLPDLSYYAGVVTWLVNHIKLLLDDNAEKIGETYTLPLEPIIALSKNINLHDTSGGGYIANAIESLKRISATTFDMTNLMSHFTQDAIKEVDLFYKMFRLESIVTFTDHKGVEKKAVVLQFPKSTIDNIISAIKENRVLKELLLFDSELFSTNNEIEILFGLWARDQLISNIYKQRVYTWNELRESVAPTSSLPEFKRKFTNVMIAHADPDYKAKIDDKVKNKITNVVGTIHLSGKNQNDKVVEYGRSALHGFLINVGYSSEHGCPIISFRRDLTGMSIVRGLGSNL